jgi:hypothetical protein
MSKIKGWKKIRDDNLEVIYSSSVSSVKVGAFKITEGELKNKWWVYRGTPTSIKTINQPFGFNNKKEAVALVKNFMRRNPNG